MDTLFPAPTTGTSSMSMDVTLIYIQMHTYAHNPWETYGSRPFPPEPQLVSCLALSLETLPHPLGRTPGHVCPAGRRAAATHLPLTITSHCSLSRGRDCPPEAACTRASLELRQKTHRGQGAGALPGGGRERCQAGGLQKGSPRTWNE